MQNQSRIVHIVLWDLKLVAVALCGSGQEQVFETRHCVLGYTAEVGQYFFHQPTQMWVLRHEDVRAFRLAEKVGYSSRRIARRDRKRRMSRTQDS